jgi:hypothetical protein
MQFEKLKLNVSKPKDFLTRLNAILDFIIVDLAKLKSANSEESVVVRDNKPTPNKAHPLRGRLSLPLRASTLQLEPRDTVPEVGNTLFIDSADGKLKFLDEALVVQDLY